MFAWSACSYHLMSLDESQYFAQSFRSESPSSRGRMTLNYRYNTVYIDDVKTTILRIHSMKHRARI
jgi:hypothetical protein